MTIRTTVSEDANVVLVQQLIANLEEQLKVATPLLPRAMVDLHKHLQGHEELAHLMDDEDLMLLRMAHEKHKGIQIVKLGITAAKKSARTKVNVASIPMGGL